MSRLFQDAWPEKPKTINVRPRIPPLARKSSSTTQYRITLLSAAKLEREYNVAEPNLRRQLGHTIIHQKSMELLQRGIARHLQSLVMDFDDDEDEEELDGTTPVAEREIFPVRGRNRGRSRAQQTPRPQSRTGSEHTRTPVSKSTQPVTGSRPEGLLVKGRRYVDKLFNRRTPSQLSHWSAMGQHVVGVAV